MLRCLVVALSTSLLVLGCSPEPTDDTPAQDSGRQDVGTSDVVVRPDVATDIAPIDDAADGSDAELDAPTDTTDATDASDTTDGSGAADAANDAEADARDTAPDVEDADTIELPDCLIDCEFPGQTTCDDRGFLRTCSDPDGDGCYSFAQPRSCATGSRCLDGACVEDDCTNECAARGITECDGTSGLRTCGNYDEDACFEWSPTAACTDGGTCSAGRCSGPCEDECEESATTCVGSRIATCGNFDGDACLEFSTATDCDAGQTCIDGACEPIPEDDFCLVISEYVEGSSNNKAIELQNCGASVLDTRGLGVCLLANGTTTSCNGGTLMLTRSIEPGDVFVICALNAPPATRPRCDVQASVANFSGNDVVVVFEDVNDNEAYNHASEPIIDAFGSRTSPPSREIWTDMTLRRCRRDAFGGSGSFDYTDYFTRSPLDDVSDLGIPSSFPGCP